MCAARAWFKVAEIVLEKTNKQKANKKNFTTPVRCQSFGLEGPPTAVVVVGEKKRKHTE